VLRAVFPNLSVYNVVQRGDPGIRQSAALPAHVGRREHYVAIEALVHVMVGLTPLTYTFT
jgi:hypothetical protein